MEERRIVTVLFCDVTGSTALASQLDPEEWAELIAEAFPLLIEPVERYGGNVARLMGDAVLAFFGAPVAHEDDPRRAILAGLAILDNLQTFREEIRADYGQDFNVRIGINTGTVVVGDFGTARTFEYTAMGDAVNIAARMEQTAEPGSIQVAAPTYRQAAPYFTWESLGDIEVRGRDEPVESYRVIGRATEPGRYRGGDAINAPTLGREQEQAALDESLVRLQEGQGGVVAIIGEAGLGKSRLLDDLRREWLHDLGDHPMASWIENRLLSFESSIPYVLFRRWLANGLHIDEQESPSSLRSKIASAFDTMSPLERERAIQATTQLFARSMTGDGFQGNGAGQVGGLAGSDEFHSELIELAEWLWRQWLGECGQGVYVIDDFHSADLASTELIEPLLERTADLPLLVMLAFRPDQQAPAWMLHRRLSEQLSARYQSVALMPLDEQRSGDLFDRLLEGAQFPRRFREQILERIDGNPLFAEELVRSLVEQNLVVQASGENGAAWTVAPGVDLSTFRIPESVQALIQDRLDRLNSDTRQTLQLAAVIGSMFSHDDLAAVSDDPAKIDDQLTELRRAMLIRMASPENEQEYVFHHALTWETVYHSILRRRRRRLHRHIGESLEERYAGQLDERRLALLSRHFAEAGDERAIDYSIEAGDQAAALYAPDEAIEYYSRAIDVAQRLNADFPGVHVYHQRGLALRTTGQYERAREDFDEALQRSRFGSDHQLEWQILLDIGESWEGIDYQQAGEWYAAALESARSIAEPECVARALGRMGNWYSNVEQIPEARKALGQALEIYQTSGNRRGLAETYDLLGAIEDIAGDADRMLAYWRQAAEIFEELDDPIRLSSTLAGIAIAAGAYPFETTITVSGFSAREAFAAAERSLELARAAGWRSGEAYALEIFAMLSIWHGPFNQALAAAREGLEIAEEIEHLEWKTVGNFTVGYIFDAFLGKDAALVAYESAYILALESGSTFFSQMGIGVLSSALIERNQLGSAEELLAEASEDPSTNTISTRRIAVSRAELALAQGNAARALEIVDQLYATAINLTQPGDIPILARMRGLALFELGRLDEARGMFEAAIAGASRRGPRFRLWQLHLELGRIHAAAGQPELARQEFEAARAEILAADESLSEPDLKSSFRIRALEMVENAEVALDQPE